MARMFLTVSNFRDVPDICLRPYVILVTFADWEVNGSISAPSHTSSRPAHALGGSVIPKSPNVEYRMSPNIYKNSYRKVELRLRENSIRHSN